MAVLESKMASTKNVRSGNEDFTKYKAIKTSKMVLLDGICHKIILVSLNLPYLIIKELVLKGTEMVGGGGGGK